MPRPTYLNFDLLVERAGDDCIARVLQSPAGDTRGRVFTLPFDHRDLENFFLRMVAVGRSVRRVESPEMALVKGFGGDLFDTVFDGDVLRCLTKSLDRADQRGAGLRIRLRIEDVLHAPVSPGAVETGKKRPVVSLADIPWEFLYDRSTDEFLALQRTSPLVRYAAMPEAVEPLSVEAPLRILVMMSSPRGYAELEVEREWQKLQQALGDLTSVGKVTLERLRSPTLEALRRQLLRGGPYHIFHFIGHAQFNEKVDDGELLLETTGGQPHPVSGQKLAVVMAQHNSIRLVVLNACEGARGSAEDPFAASAQTLIRVGIPAVIAMQLEMTDESAILLSREFYTTLTDGYPIDTALSEARAAIYTDVSPLEWAIPVLYMRSEDGSIFQIGTAELRDLQERVRLKEEEHRRREEEAAAVAAEGQRQDGEERREREEQAVAERQRQEQGRQQQEEERRRRDEEERQRRAEKAAAAAATELPRQEDERRREEEATAVEAKPGWRRRFPWRSRRFPWRSRHLRRSQASHPLSAAELAESRAKVRSEPARGPSDTRARAGVDVNADEREDVVDCTVFAPAFATPGDQVFVQVFAHLMEQAQDAGSLAGEFDADAERRAVMTLETIVRRGSSLMFELRIARLTVRERVHSLTWRGRPVSAQFEVEVPQEARLGTYIGTVTVSLESVPIGHVKFKLALVPKDARPERRTEPVGDDAKRYKTAFVSYSSKDRKAVLERVQMLKPLGIDYFQDLLDLDPGDRWERELYLSIAECDLFLLFWSSEAKASRWVRRELQYALERKGGDDFARPEILPVIIEGPPITPPWPEVAHLHFGDPLVYFMAQPG